MAETSLRTRVLDEERVEERDPAYNLVCEVIRSAILDLDRSGTSREPSEPVMKKQLREHNDNFCSAVSFFWGENGTAKWMVPSTGLDIDVLRIALERRVRLRSEITATRRAYFHRVLNQNKKG